MTALAPTSQRSHRLGPGLALRCLHWVVGGWLCLASLAVHAGPLVTADSPIGFFTNVASRLLQSQLNLPLDRIQLYPTNQYTPSVHRLLQVSANLYDALTNRTITGYPYLPSVFRPLFTNDSGAIYITGYLEETGTRFLTGNVHWRDLQLADDRAGLQPADMVYGVPVVIGAKRGFPNFNAFEMQTLVQVARKLQFRRQPGPPTSPIYQTNQMFVVTISNVFGIEAWNSYITNFPRNLRLSVMPEVSVTLTNEVGNLLVNQRYQPPVTVADIAAGTWSAYDPGQEQYSLRIPVFTNLLFLTNSTFSRALDAFVPLTVTFETTTPAFYVPRWWLCVRTRLRFALIDTSVNRIVDFVNLDSAETNLNITDTLMWNYSPPYGGCGTNYTPSASDISMWCTNHHPIQADENLPTYGVLNQIFASMGLTEPDWSHALGEFPPGLDRHGAIDFFRFQFLLAPIYYPGVTFYPSNTFTAPFQPIGNVYLFTSWQANDPLVHYTVSDLTDLNRTNRFGLGTIWSTISDLGWVNRRYEPWGGNPAAGSASHTRVNLTVKDPFMLRSDYWDFPTNPLPSLAWLGRVHRGTPWQTLYLKSSGTSFDTWRQWTGNDRPAPNRNGGTAIVWDAFFTQPTNDWRLASLLISLLTTNNPRHLASVNQPGVAGWCGLLDGMTVLTNTAPGQFDPVIMWSNSPQAATVATALDTARSSQPGQLFRDPADILATPGLSVASPWLDPSGAAQLESSMNDLACEAIPSQLLPLLRPDSIGAVSQSGGTWQVQFSGADGYAYAVQTSSNLLDWTSVSTNHPANGSFTFADTALPGSPRRFYRSALLP